MIVDTSNGKWFGCWEMAGNGNGSDRQVVY